MRRTRKAYREYLQSDDWKRKRAKKRKKCRHCAACGSRFDLQVHHVVYKQWYDVETKHLRVVCGRCHTRIHELMRSGHLVWPPHTNHQGRWAATVRALATAPMRPEETPFWGPS